jgi:ABC-type transporter Mla MlaB component
MDPTLQPEDIGMECLTISQIPQGKKITFRGSCTIENAAAIATLLGNEITSDQDILIDLAEVEAADLSFFQLLSVYERSCKKNSTIRISIDMPQALCDLAGKSGFEFSSTDA